MGQHDLSYRLFFQQRSMIRDLLVEMVGEPWVDCIDFATGELVGGSLVAGTHESREMDIVWKFGCDGIDGPQEIYIHLELQSRPDPTMPVRMMGYDALLYQKIVAKRIVPIRNKIPLIISIALYNGLGPWNGATDFGSLIGVPEVSAEIYRPQLRFLLVEQRLFSPERLAPLRSPVALLFRIENSRDWKDLPGNVELLRQTVTDPFLREAFESWLQKVILPRLGISEEASAQLSLKEMETMLAERIDQWNREIREEGRQEGLEKGLERGQQKGRAEVLLRLLSLKFGTLSPEIEERVRTADSDRLLEWSERILTAERLEDVFGSARG
jgi:predicted transposase YdaD